LSRLIDAISVCADRSKGGEKGRETS